MSTTVDAPGIGAPTSNPTELDTPSTAEVLGAFRRELIAQGFDNDQAFDLVSYAYRDVLVHDPLVLRAGGEVK